MKIIVEKVLDDFWADDETLRQLLKKCLTDEQIIELICEDLSAFIDGAKWKIER